MTIRIFLLLVLAAGIGLGQVNQNPLDKIPERLSIPSDNVCGTLEHTLTGRPVVNMRLELKPVSYKFLHPHESSVQVHVGKTVKKSSSSQDGKFDLRGAAPGLYELRIASAPNGAWAEFKILPRSGRNGCPLQVVLDAEQKTVALSKNPAQPEKTELTLKIILDKGTYALHDKVFAKTAFTNVSQETLCFPEPAQEEIVATRGVLTMILTRPDSSEEGQFLKTFDARWTWPREKLLPEIKEHWIWLTPNAVYVTKSVQLQTTLSEPGDWRLKTTYRPPEGAFGPTEYKEYLSSAALSAGCTLPQSDVSAEPTRFSVSP
jgi:hypothetical protein